MRRGTSFQNIHGARRWIARLALFLFALQATLPAGFMPDPGALKAGQYEIVICSGTGFRTITVDENGKPVDHNDTDGSGAFACPFATVAAGAVTVPSAPFIHLPAAGGLAHSAPDPQVPTPGTAGPALGSRAPPEILV